MPPKSSAGSGAGSDAGGNEAEAAPGKPRVNRANSLCKAIAKIEIQKLYAQQRAAELKIAEEYNELFKHKANLRSRETMEKFWGEIKKRLVKKFGSIPQAFHALDSSGDGSLSFLEFVDMLRQINLPLDQRVVRGLFDKASGGDREMSLEEMKTLLLDKTIRKLRFVMEAFNSKQERVQGHQHRFIRRLTQTDELNRLRSVERFQRKFTIQFCREELWQALLKKVEGGAGNPQIDKKAFTEVMTTFVTKEEGSRLLAYEVTFMQRIFDRVDLRRSGSVGVSELSMACLMLGNSVDRRSKAVAAFDLFDSDGDGCLLYEEILELCICICARRPMVEEKLRHAHQLDFQEELSAQEGRRAYELALWHMQRIAKVEGGIATKREWIEVLDSVPDVLDCLIPGSVRMNWVLDPSYSEDAEPSSPVWPPTKQLFAAWPSSVTSAASFMQGRGIVLQPSLPGRRGVQPLAVYGEEEVIRANKFKSTQTKLFKQTLSSWGDLRLAELTSGFIAPPEVQGDADTPPSSAGATSVGGASLGGGGRGGVAVGAGGGGGVSGAGTTGGSRASGTRAGLGSSRAFSAPSLAPPQTPGGASDATARSPTSRAGAGARLGQAGGSSLSLRPPSAALSSTSGGGGGGGLRSPGGRRGGTLGASGKGSGRTSRRPGSLAGAGSPKGGGILHASASAGSLAGGHHGHTLGSFGSFAEEFEVPPVPAEKWGAESADRFRLFAAVTIASGRYTIDRPDPGAPLSHKCFVCLDTHKFTVDGPKG